MLPIAMLTGALFHSYLYRLSFLIPVLIFCMLFLTYSKVSPKKIRFSRLHMLMLLFQIVGSIVLYILVLPFNEELAQGLMICVLAPTAAAAAVITGMLGGNVAFLASFVFLSNLGVALVAPVVFSFIGIKSELTFWISFKAIFAQIFPLLILPLFSAWAIQYFFPKMRRFLISIQVASYYLWAVSLTIVTGRTVHFLLLQENPDYRTEILLLILTLILAVIQFWTGKSLGSHYKNRIAGGQGLGQKNTILAIWMAQIYLSPVASIGPAAYVLWQNIINSWQLYKKRNQESVIRSQKNK